MIRILLKVFWLLVLGFILLKMVSRDENLYSEVSCTAPVPGSHLFASCRIKNLCMNAEYGIFVLGSSSSPKPSILLNACSEDGCQYSISIPVLAYGIRNFMNIIHMHRSVLVVAGTFAPFHLAHQIMNSMVPIQHLLVEKEIEGSGARVDLLTMGRYLTKEEAQYKYPTEFMDFGNIYSSGVSEYVGEGGPSDDFFSVRSGKSLALDPFGSDTVCYELAYVGLGDVCYTCTRKPSREAHELVREKLLHYYALPAAAEPEKIVIVSRKTRKILNADQIGEMLHCLQLPYTEVQLEYMPFVEQAGVFAGASMVIAPHGNGNTHIHWMEKGTIFVEVFNPAKFGFGRYSVVAEIRELRYFPLLCTGRECSDLASSNPRMDDTLVDVWELEKIVRKEIEYASPRRGVPKRCF